MCVVCSRLRDNNEGSEFGRDGQQEHRERRMGVLGKKKTEQAGAHKEQVENESVWGLSQHGPPGQ